MSNLAQDEEKERIACNLLIACHHPALGMCVCVCGGGGVHIDLTIGSMGGYAKLVLLSP